MARFSVSRESIQSKRKSEDAPEALDDNEAEVDEMELLIQKICGMSWFPKSALRRMKKARRTTHFGVDGNSLIVDQLFSELGEYGAVKPVYRGHLIKYVWLSIIITAKFMGPN